MAQFSAIAVMLIAVAVECLIFEFMGRPECCVAEMDEDAGGTKCLDHPGQTADIEYRLIKSYIGTDKDRQLGIQCPKITGRHSMINRQYLLAHFAVNLFCVFLIHRVGHVVFLRLRSKAEKVAKRIQNETEKKLEPTNEDTD